MSKVTGTGPITVSYVDSGVAPKEWKSRQTRRVIRVLGWNALTHRRGSSARVEELHGSSIGQSGTAKIAQKAIAVGRVADWERPQ